MLEGWDFWWAGLRGGPGLAFRKKGTGPSPVSGPFGERPAGGVFRVIVALALSRGIYLYEHHHLDLPARGFIQNLLLVSRDEPSAEDAGATHADGEENLLAVVFNDLRNLYFWALHLHAHAVVPWIAPLRLVDTSIPPLGCPETEAVLRSLFWSIPL